MTTALPITRLFFTAALLGALSAFPSPPEKATNEEHELPPIAATIALKDKEWRKSSGTLVLPKTGVSVRVSIPAIKAVRLYSEARVVGSSMGPTGPTVRISAFSKERRLLSMGEEACFESRLRSLKQGDACTVVVSLPAVPNQAGEFTIVVTPLAQAPKEISVSFGAFDPHE